MGTKLFAKIGEYFLQAVFALASKWALEKS